MKATNHRDFSRLLTLEGNVWNDSFFELQIKI